MPPPAKARGKSRRFPRNTLSVSLSHCERPPARRPFCFTSSSVRRVVCRFVRLGHALLIQRDPSTGERRMPEVTKRDRRQSAPHVRSPGSIEGDLGPDRGETGKRRKQRPTRGYRSRTGANILVPRVEKGTEDPSRVVAQDGARDCAPRMADGPTRRASRQVSWRRRRAPKKAAFRRPFKCRAPCESGDRNCPSGPHLAKSGVAKPCEAKRHHRPGRRLRNRRLDLPLATIEQHCS